jgi:hypothetical protein
MTNFGIFYIKLFTFLVINDINPYYNHNYEIHINIFYITGAYLLFIFEINN